MMKFESTEDNDDDTDDDSTVSQLEPPWQKWQVSQSNHDKIFGILDQNLEIPPKWHMYGRVMGVSEQIWYTTLILEWAQFRLFLLLKWCWEWLAIVCGGVQSESNVPRNFFSTLVST
jgi:hypothetical protein